MPVLDGEWCLICEQRPARGVMQRVYVDNGKAVVTDGRPLPKVCQECADQHAQTQAQSASGRFTMWQFDKRVPASDE